MELRYQMNHDANDEAVHGETHHSHATSSSHDNEEQEVLQEVLQDVLQDNDEIKSYKESTGTSADFRSNSRYAAAKRKRRKPIKSCAFCRQRKLRCDQKRPMCTTCLKRGLKSCVYTESSSPGVSFSSSQVLNEDLLLQVDELKKRLREFEERDELRKQNTLVPEGPGNILRDICYFQRKENGRRTMFGPTAVRSFFMDEGWGFIKKYAQLWSKVKDERNKMKRDTGYSMLGENALIEEPCAVLPTRREEYTILNEFMDALPTYEVILQRLIMFFDDSELYVINDAFDGVKVMKDFKESFIPGMASTITNERPIVKLISSSKKNYYKIGVVLGIFMYTSVHYKMPLAFDKFFVVLNGLSTGKTNYIERVQVTFLMYCFRAKWGLTGGDSPHTIMLLNSMVNEALLIGLNTDIEVTFRNQESVFGNLQALRELWLWILFCDVDVALQMGSLLKVSDELIFDESIFEIGKENPNSLKNLTGSFLKMARPMLISIFNKKFTPDLEAYCEEIIQFIEKKFPPISYYTDKDLIDETSLSTTIVLSSVISLLLAFYGLRSLAFRDRTCALRNHLGTATLISFSLSVNLIIKNYEKDKIRYPETLKDNFKNLSPYMCLTVSFLHRLIVRSLSIFYTSFYYKVTLFESGSIMLNTEEKSVLEMKSLRVQTEENLSLISIFEKFSEIFDQLTNSHDPVFNTLVRRSHILVTTFALERLCHKVMEKVLESRKFAENSWMLQYQNEIETSDANSPSADLMACSASQKTDTSRQENSVGVTILPDPNVAGMAGSIESDFWTTYNIGWEEFLSNADYIDIYNDLMKRY